MLGTRRAELVGRHAKRRGRAIDVELGALEQLLGDQEGARVATCVDGIEGTREQALSDVGRVSAHRHDEAELRIAWRPVGQVVGEQKALARARRDDAPAVGDRLYVHRHVIEASRTILAPPIQRGPGRGTRAPPPAYATPFSPQRQALAPSQPAERSAQGSSHQRGHPKRCRRPAFNDRLWQDRSMRVQKPQKRPTHLHQRMPSR